MILTILVSMLVYIFWFIRSEFQRVLDRIDQSTLGIARMQRELTQSTVQQLNNQLQESFKRLEEEEYDDEDEDEDEGEEDEEDEEDVEGEDQEGPEGDKLDDDPQEIVEDTLAVKAVENEIETAIEELDAVMTEAQPKKRGRKPNK